jgi:hypothetical protein
MHALFFTSYRFGLCAIEYQLERRRHPYVVP